MSLKPFTYPFPETRFLHAGPNVYKFKIRYGDSIRFGFCSVNLCGDFSATLVPVDLMAFWPSLHREEEIEDKEVIIQELEDSVRAVLANMDSLQPFVTEHFTVFPYKSKWERVSHLKFKHGEIMLTPYPFVFTLYVEMKWFTGNMPTGKPTDDSPLELKMWVHRSLVSFLKVLAEKKAEETTMRKRKLVEEPNSPSRPRPHRAKIETSSEAFSYQKPLKETKRNMEGETQQEYQDTPVFDATDVQEQDSKLEHSLPGLVVPPLQHSNPLPPKEPGSSGFFGFLSTLFPFPYFFRKSSQ